MIELASTWKTWQMRSHSWARSAAVKSRRARSPSLRWPRRWLDEAHGVEGVEDAVGGMP